MSDCERIILLIESVMANPRSKEESIKTFQGAGIIDENGDLKYPYQGLKI